MLPAVPFSSLRSWVSSFLCSFLVLALAVPAVAQDSEGGLVPAPEFVGPRDASPDPVPRRGRYLALVRYMAFSHGVDVRLVDAVIRTESAYRPRAVSPAGAVGLMQLMPGTARQYGVRNRFDPVQNVRGGVAYLRDLLNRFSLVNAIAAYNAGPGAVRRYGGVPPYPETEQFVGRVLLRYAGTGRGRLDR